MLTDDELINTMTGAPSGWTTLQTLLQIGRAVEAAVLKKQSAPCRPGSACRLGTCLAGECRWAAATHRVVHESKGEQKPACVQPSVIRAVDCAHEEGCCSSQCQAQRRCVERPDGVALGEPAEPESPALARQRRLVATLPQTREEVERLKPCALGACPQPEVCGKRGSCAERGGKQ